MIKSGLHKCERKTDVIEKQNKFRRRTKKERINDRANRAFDSKLASKCQYSEINELD